MSDIKVSKVYANPTIFKVHDRVKLGSLQDSAEHSIDQMYGPINSSQRKLSVNLPTSKLQDIRNTLSPTY